MRNSTDLPASRSAVTASAAPVDRLVAEPEAAVEVEQEVVVAANGRGERHARRIILARRAPTPRRPHRLPRPPRRRLRRGRRTRRHAGGRGHRGGARRQRVPARGLRERREAGAEGRRRRSRSPTRSSTSPRPTSPRSRRPAATSRSRSTPSSAPITGGSFKYLADQKFFDGLTFHRIVAGLRDPGRRPGRRRLRRPGLHRRRGAAERPHLRRGRRRDGQDRRPSRPARRARSSSSSPAPGPRRCRPTTRCWARSRGAWRSSTKIGAIQADPNGTPAAQVVIKSITVDRGRRRARPRAPGARACAPDRRRSCRARRAGQHAVAGDDDRDRVARARRADRARGLRVAGARGELAVADRLPARHLRAAPPARRAGTARASAAGRRAGRARACRPRSTPTSASRGAAISRSEPITFGPARRRPRPARGPRARSRTRSAPAPRALDDEQRPDRGLQAGEDGVGEPFAHRGGGDGLQQRFGQGGHA